MDIHLRRPDGYSSLMAKEGTRMRRDKTFTDFQITFNDQSFWCHRYVVSLHSPYFKGMLMSGMRESTEQSATIPNIKPNIMEIILDYMYVGDVSFPPTLLMDMIRASDYLAISQLRDMCIDQVKSILTPSNVISWLYLARRLELQKIKTMCKHVMLADFQEVTSHEDFLKLDAQEVKSYMCHVLSSEKGMKEDVVQAMMEWVRHDASQRIQYLSPLLRQVNLDQYSYRALISFTCKYGFLIERDQNSQLLLMKVMQTQQNAVKPVSTETTPTLIIAGGDIGEELVDDVNRMCWSLNQPNEFEELFKMPSSIATRHSACKTPKGICFSGGVDSNLCAIFEPDTMSWVKLRSLPSEMYGHGSVCIRGVLFVIGGGPSGELSNYVICIELEGGKVWRWCPKLPIDVAYPKVCEAEGTAYLLDEDTKQLLKLDVVRKTWIRLSTLLGNENCIGVSMAAVNGLLCVAGGFSRICAWYNLTTDTWSTGPQLNGCHWYGSLVFHDGKLLVLGGDKGNVDTDDVEEIDVSTGAVSVSTISMPRSLWRHHAFVLDVTTG